MIWPSSSQVSHDDKIEDFTENNFKKKLHSSLENLFDQSFQKSKHRFFLVSAKLGN